MQDFGAAIVDPFYGLERRGGFEEFIQVGTASSVSHRVCLFHMLPTACSDPDLVKSDFNGLPMAHASHPSKAQLNDTDNGGRVHTHYRQHSQSGNLHNNL
jgi:hypothetical protein